MKEPYSILGRYFEYLNDNCDYTKWSQYVHIVLKKYSKSMQKGLDIGCGNGYFTRYFAKLGIDMTAIDCSESMLQVAKVRASGQVHKGQTSIGKTSYIWADILEFKTAEEQDFAIAINDCINYIAPNALPAAFQNVADSLRQGGIFIFDISTLYKFRELLDGEDFCDDKGQVAYIWRNNLTKEYLEIFLTFFIQEQNQLYRREEEYHRQYVHSKFDIQKKLEQAGFALLECTGHLGDKKDKFRTNFICKKL